MRRYGAGDTAVDALRGVSVDIAQGPLTAIMGPSGSGKSTLMDILAGLDKPTSGQVSVAGVDVTSLDDTALTRLRRDHIGFIFQFFNLLPMLTAAENIVLPLKLAGGSPDPAWLEELIGKVGRPAARAAIAADRARDGRGLPRVDAQLAGRVLIGLGLAQTMTRGFLTVFVVVIPIDLLHMGEPGVGLLTAAVGAGAVASSLGAVMFVPGTRLA